MLFLKSVFIGRFIRKRKEKIITENLGSDESIGKITF